MSKSQSGSKSKVVLGRVRWIIAVAIFAMVAFSATAFRSGETTIVSAQSSDDPIAARTPPVESTDSEQPSAVFLVTNANDAGGGSLRQAILDANGAAGADTINFDAAFFATPRVISLATGQLTITDSVTINGPGANRLAVSGGGVTRVFAFTGGTSTLSAMLINGGNGVGTPFTGLGGGIVVAGPANLTVLNCTVTGNTAGKGGGIVASTNAVLSIINSTISDNISNGNVEVAGGIFSSGSLTVTNSTVSGNSASGINNIGGGIISAHTSTITNSTITNNAANGSDSAGGILAYIGTVTLRNSIVAGNVNNAAVPDVGAFVAAGGSFASNGYNLIGNRGDVTVFAQTGDQTGTGASPLNPLLGTLTGNGGTTATHALLGGSPALDKGSNSGSPLPTTDQRGAGFNRVVDLTITNAASGDGTDIGAFEAQTLPTCGQLTPITVGTPVNGTLALGDCTLPLDGSYLDAYTFSGTAGQQISISLNSTAFNAFLFLLQGGTAESTQIASDDNSGGGTNARIPANGFFTLPATGTYTILANSFAAGQTGAYTLTLSSADTTAPTASATAPNVTTAGGSTHTVTVTYTDNIAINVSTLGTGDITVTGPGGFTATPTFVNVNPAGNGTPRTATYSVTPPGGSWDAADNGTYSINMVANQVADTGGNFVAAGPIASFNVSIAACQAITVNPTTLPNAAVGSPYSQTLTATGGTAPYTFQVTTGALPSGLTLNANGTLSGTPTAAGTSNSTITATDSTSPTPCTGSRAYSIVVVTPSPITNADVTEPGNPIVGVAATLGSSTSTASTIGFNAGQNNHPEFEGPAKAIENVTSSGKYLNFAETGVGFIVTAHNHGPQTVLSGVRFFTANDAPERDPATITIEGTNSPNPTTTLNSTWTTVYNGVSGLSTDPGRNSAGATINFANTGAFASYRVLVTSLRNGATANAMQFSEIELIGSTAASVGVRAPFDYDGDNKTDISIFRPGPGEWWVLRSSNGTNFALQFGNSTDKLVPADYTGDNKADVAFWRPSTGSWFVLRSEDFTFFAFPFGANGDVPVPGDFDGDNKADAAVFRPSTLNWFILKSTGGTDIFTFGAPGDKPVVADYDGDRKADIAIYRPTGATGPAASEWWIRRSSNASVFALQFGSSTDKATQGDFTGDGKSDIAFWRPSNGTWFVLRSEDFSFFAFPFGANGDTPVAGDYDGDGKFDAGVFRPSSFTWFIQRSMAGTLIQSFGIPGDIPTPSAYVP